MSEAPLRVLLADDKAAFRAGFCAALAGNNEIVIVGQAPDGDEALRLPGELQPDVVVMDLSMPAIDGIEATRRLVQRSPHIAVLVLTMFDDDESVFAAMRAGARGYLVKGARREDIVRAIRAVGAGEAIFGPAVARRISEYFGKRSQPSAVLSDPFPELTERERQVLDMMASGQNNAVIAQRLALSPKTVRNHASEHLHEAARRRPSASHHPRQGRRFGSRRQLTTSHHRCERDGAAPPSACPDGLPQVRPLRPQMS